MVTMSHPPTIQYHYIRALKTLPLQIDRTLTAVHSLNSSILRHAEELMDNCTLAKCPESVAQIIIFPPLC